MTIFTSNCLSGKRYLVTGGSSGIGKEVAKLIAECGGSLVISGRDQARLNVVLSSLHNLERHHAEPVDLIGVELIAKWTQYLVEKYGKFDGVFHAAGQALIKPVRLINDRNVSDIVGASFYGAMGLAKGFSKKNAMVDGGGLIFMSSVAGTTGQTGMSLYSASKAAVDGMTRSLACELAPRGITVNSIAAGAVETEMHKKLVGGSSEEVINSYREMHPLGFGKPQDIAGMAVFLFSPAGKWITGSVVHVDGGYTAR